jgi:proton-translocating NADH-quinone oxidoreductase chain L
MYLLITFLPLINFFSIYCFKKFLNKEELLVLSCFNIFCALCFTSVAIYEVIYLKYTCYCMLFSWISFDIIDINWFFLFDFLSITMCFVVLFISFLVHLYSLEYMTSDPFLLRFISFLSLSTFFMLLLVTSGNLLQLFFGWEGVGLSSYLLINFWYTRVSANKSAMKAIIVNRISDSALYLGLFIIFFLFKTFDFPILSVCSNFLIDYTEKTRGLVDSFIETSVFESGREFFDTEIVVFETVNMGVYSGTLFELVWYFLFSNNWDFLFWLNLACLCVFIGAMGKSAQLGLHTWLPDAMEGPTPVSALIHAATMVTAGVYLLIRMSFLFIYCPNILVLIIFIGSLTTFFAGSVGCFQNDIKKIIAYSTCSQLGYMFVACGSANFNVALFHLFNHAFFKALLFLGAGSIIHALHDEQDIRRYGGLHKFLPLTYIGFIIASLSIAGFPFLTGFYSKDLILELNLNYSIHTILFSQNFVWLLGICSVFFTVVYSVRLLYYTFFSYPNLVVNVNIIRESSTLILISLIVLIFCSIFVGFFFKDLFIGPGLDSINSSFFISQYSDILLNIEFLDFFYKFYPLIVSLLGCFFFLLEIIYFRAVKVYKFIYTPGIIDYNFYNFNRFFNQKWFFDLFYKFIFILPILKWSYYITFKLIDRGVLEFFGSFNNVFLFTVLTKNMNVSNSGFIYHYIFSFIFNLGLFIGLYVYMCIYPLENNELTYFLLDYCGFLVLSLCVWYYSNIKALFVIKDLTTKKFRILYFFKKILYILHHIKIYCIMLFIKIIQTALFQCFCSFSISWIIFTGTLFKWEAFRALLNYYIFWLKSSYYLDFWYTKWLAFFNDYGYYYLYHFDDKARVYFFVKHYYTIDYNNVDSLWFYILVKVINTFSDLSIPNLFEFLFILL